MEKTYKQNLYDDLTLPLSLLQEHMESLLAENASRETCACIGEILIKNARENYLEIADALVAEFGKIKIEHESSGYQIYHWGKVIGVSSEK